MWGGGREGGREGCHDLVRGVGQLKIVISKFTDRLELGR